MCRPPPLSSMITLSAMAATIISVEPRARSCWTNSAEGGAGDDQLSGGLGRDELVGGVGDDLLTGGAGQQPTSLPTSSPAIWSKLAEPMRVPRVSQLDFSQTENGVLLTLQGGNTITFEGLSLDDLDRDNFMLIA